MLRFALRPKAALHLRPLLRWSLPLLAALGCSHSDPFQLGTQQPGGPHTSGFPRRITYAEGPDVAPSATADGWLYSYLVRYNTSTLDYCMASLPLEGGGRSKTYCDVSYGIFGVTSAVTWPVQRTDGLVAYLRTRGVPSGGPTLSTNLLLGSFAIHDSGQLLRHFPYPRGAGLVRGLSHLAWLDQHTLIFVATDITHPGNASQDTVEVGLQVERLDLAHLDAAPDFQPGTDGATSVDAAPDGSGFYFTLHGDTRVYRRTLGSGATSTVFDFGGANYARDARMADSVLYAVVGGTIDPDDLGGTLMRVDLRTSALDSLPVPGLLIRHPAVSRDHHRVMVESQKPDPNLWLLEVP